MHTKTTGDRCPVSTTVRTLSCGGLIIAFALASGCSSTSSKTKVHQFSPVPMAKVGSEELGKPQTKNATELLRAANDEWVKGNEAQRLGDHLAIDAQRALDWGLVSAVVPAAELMTQALALAEKVLTRGPLAIRLAKLALNASARVDLDSGLLFETLAQAICFDSRDKQEGTSAFLEKRTPKFTGD